MRKYLLILIIFVGLCSCGYKNTTLQIDMAGKWEFALDPEDKGLEERWYERTLPDNICLPGSLQEQGYGYAPGLDTKWTGGVADSAFFKDAKYAKYRKQDNFKIPFWLQPEKHYVGVAWYKRDIEIPSSWQGKYVTLELERTHWETTLFIDGRQIGDSDALQVPHRYAIDKTGKLTIAIRVDNRLNVPVGVSAHSVSDQTQSNWNGIVGSLTVTAKPSLYIEDVQIYPDVEGRKAKVVVTVGGESTGNEAEYCITANSFNTSKKIKLAPLKGKFNHKNESHFEAEFDMGTDMLLWSEFEPNMYKAVVEISSAEGRDVREVNFGMRHINANGRRFEVNGTPIFLRGTLECCIFPLTGYPAMDEAYWEKIYSRVKEFGMNHVRFHSWCPPKAAFDVADREGVYLQIECGVWANVNIGDGEYIDRWIYEEGDRILKEYGNHPSFCLMTHGNEPSGGNQVAYLSGLIDHWKSEDPRHVYSSAGGWPYVDNADYWNTPDPRIQGYGQNLNSVINAEPPRTDYDFVETIRSVDMPTVAHEIGDWCAYPNFKEIEKYTGVLKAKNFEIFQETLGENHLGDLAEEFLYASGRLQVLCYKADIEAALRTPEFAGFQQLALLDFPGQGTALVGVLDAFWDPKGYVNGREYSSFCDRTVPLARMHKMIWNNEEEFKASIEVSHFGESKIDNASILWEIRDRESGKVISKGNERRNLPIDNCIAITDIACDLSPITQASHLELSVRIPEAKAENKWSIWVYPKVNKPITDEPFVTSDYDKAVARAQAGENVLFFIPKGGVRADKGGNVVVGFSSIFWNTAWTLMQEPHEFGVYCDPAHPVFSHFPNDGHSDYQWWDIVYNTSAMDMTDFPAEYRPTIHLIDDWFTNKKLGILFETTVGEGKLMVCSIDLEKNMEERPASRQLLHSIKAYMASDNFEPANELDLNVIKALIK